MTSGVGRARRGGPDRVRVGAALAVATIVALGSVPSAVAFEGGGRKPSEAPLIAVGQHNMAQLTNHADDANFGGQTQVALWRLPPLSARDVIYVDWHSIPSTKSPGHFPVCLTFAQGVDDYSWGTRFDEATGYACEGSRAPVYTLSGSGTARTAITIPETSANSSYLEFYTPAEETNPARFEVFPYDFTLEPPLHYLSLAIQEMKRVKPTGVIRATATLANGLPAPDGLAFSLAVTWPKGSASYTGVSSGGVVGFQLALPTTAYGERATFVASHPADGTYIGVSSRLRINVVKPPKPRHRHRHHRHHRHHHHRHHHR